MRTTGVHLIDLGLSAYCTRAGFSLQTRTAYSQKAKGTQHALH